jgi:gamma-glutamylcyclotransferase (GGCT)/AIG2-like uncharacterized protein YtfP
LPAEAKPENVTAVFVYGTLKRGECRARFWPRDPIALEPAVIRGRLYDLGPYPALAPGDDAIRGELWRFAPDDMAETLRVLDEVEGATQLGNAYYRRIVVTCQCDDGRHCAAFAYEFARLDRLADIPLVPPGANGQCCWRGGKKLEEHEWQFRR